MFKEIDSIYSKVLITKAMRLKSFYATTMTEAMQMVRDNLGDDAVIVATQEERNGAVHVTAAIEPNFEIARDGSTAPADDWLQYDDEDEENAIAEELTEAMLRHSVAEDVLDNIVSCATVVGLDNSSTAMMAAMDHLFQFNPLPTGRTKKPQMMVGMPGAGKTLAVAKMAARGAMAGLKVGVISCDTIRAGGVEQLQAFTKLMQIDLQRAEDFSDLKAILPDMAHFDQVLIDTPGINPFDKNDVKMLARLMNAGDFASHLVLQAGSDTDECSEIARIFSSVGVKSLIPTRIDIARRLGGLLGAAHHGNLSFADASNTPKVADGLFALSPRDITKMLMPGAFRKSPARSSSRKTAAPSGRH